MNQLHAAILSGEGFVHHQQLSLNPLNLKIPSCIPPGLPAMVNLTSQAKLIFSINTPLRLFLLIGTPLLKQISFES